MKAKKLVAMLVVLAIVFTSAVVSFGASSPDFSAISNSQYMKVYSISTQNNTATYGNASTSNKIGTIYATDEIYVYSISGSWAYCSYPVSGGRKYAYIPLSVITSNNMAHAACVSRAQVTTYIRSDGKTAYGYVSKGDPVTAIATAGSFVQLIYPAGGVYKMAWVTLSDYNNYIKTASSSATTPSGSNVASSWQFPMANAYCTWSSYQNMSWDSYTNTGSGRNYHLGIDIAGSNTNVCAAANGTVAAVGYNGANGNYVVIRHTMPNGGTVYSFYAHLSSYCVSSGNTVSKGDKIGVMGSTGDAKGAHLHFAIVNALWSGSYYGYATQFSGNSVTFEGVTYYNPVYVINNAKLP